MDQHTHRSPYVPLGIILIIGAVIASIFFLRREPEPEPPPKPVPIALADAEVSIRPVTVGPQPPQCEVDFSAADGDAAALSELTRQAAACMGVQVLDWCDDLSDGDRAALVSIGAVRRDCP